MREKSDGDGGRERDVWGRRGTEIVGERERMFLFSISLCSLNFLFLGSIRRNV